MNSETSKLILNGLGGDDRFEIAEGVGGKIRLMLNGGTGNDAYTLNGNLRTEVYDDAAENNSIIKKDKAKIHLH